MAFPPDQLEFFARVKTIAVIALFSDDRLLEEFVLKGGGALDIAYQASSRASLDLDFSMGSDFESVEALRERISRSVVQTFAEHGFVAFDVVLTERPPGLTDDIRHFWGGYLLEFKITTPDDFHKFGSDIESLRRRAKVVGTNNSTKLTIDISKHEFREARVAKELDGYTIFVYSPEMIVAEKLRAICQQMPEYGPIVKRSRAGSARARDFLDIFVATEQLHVDFRSPDFHEIVRHMFAAKRVPLRLLGMIETQREFHRLNFPSLKDTVKPNFPLKTFDEYFDYVVARCGFLEVLWKVDPPA